MALPAFVIEPRSRQASLTEAAALHGAGRREEAAAIYSALMRADPADCDAVYLLGVLRLEEGAEEQGVKLIRYALANARFTPAFEPMLARVLAARGGAAEERLRTFLRRGRLEPHTIAGTLGGTLNIKEIEPWHFARGARPYPRKAEEFDDLQALIDRSVLDGWLPARPPFRTGAGILTLGSCFAEELRKYLAERERGARLIFVPPGLNNTFALRQFIAWSLTGERSEDAYWYDEAGTGGAVHWTPEAEQRAYADAFRTAEGIVLTVGLAEVWRDRATGGVFWRGVPRSLFDPERHVCEVSTVAENAANLRRILDLVRAHCGPVPVVLTLSPVPLRASFGERSCVTADCVSKSILRLAIDEVMRDGRAGVHYWPSFEIVKWLGAHLPYPVYGDDGNPRHVSRRAVSLILDAFIRHYYEDGGDHA